MESQWQNLFLTYANAKLPNDMKKVINSARNINKESEIFNNESHTESFRFLCECLMIFNESESIYIADGKINNNSRKDMPWIYKIALEAIFGFRDDYCPRNIDWSCTPFYEVDYCPFAFQYKFLDESKLIDSNTLTCLECSQIRFRKTLDDIISGTEFNNIVYLHDNLEPMVSHRVRQYYTIKDNVVTKKEIFTLSFSSAIVFPEGFLSTLRNENDVNYKFVLENYLHCTAGYSLLEFLVNNDRHKLKKCPYCNKYFVAKNKNRQRCYSIECEREFQKIKKRKQRENDPVKYGSLSPKN